MLIQSLNWNLQSLRQLLNENLCLCCHPRSNVLGRIKNFNNRCILLHGRTHPTPGFGISIDLLNPSNELQTWNRVYLNLRRHPFSYECYPRFIDLALDLHERRIRQTNDLLPFTHGRASFNNKFCASTPTAVTICMYDYPICWCVQDALTNLLFDVLILSLLLEQLAFRCRESCSCCLNIAVVLNQHFLFCKVLENLKFGVSNIQIVLCVSDCKSIRLQLQGLHQTF